MKKDATEKTLSALAKKVGQSVRTEAKSVKKKVSVLKAAERAGEMREECLHSGAIT